MPVTASTVSFFAGISIGTWIDIGCIIFVITLAIIDAYRGFSSTLSVLLGLLIAVHSGYWLYPGVKMVVGNTSFCHNHAQLGAILPYILAVLIGCAIYLIIRFIFKKFLKLIVEQPVDKILGTLAGIAKALLIILIIFSCASLFPKGSTLNKAFHEQSRTGRSVVPVLQNVFSQTYPAAAQQMKQNVSNSRVKKNKKSSNSKKAK